VENFLYYKSSRFASPEPVVNLEGLGGEDGREGAEVDHLGVAAEVEIETKI
jgi:hypothetical protein